MLSGRLVPSMPAANDSNHCKCTVQNSPQKKVIKTLVNIREAVLFLFHEAAPHLWQFDFYAPFLCSSYLQGGICREGTWPGHWISRYGTKWPVCSDGLRPLDLVPLTDFTYKCHLLTYLLHTVGANGAWGGSLALHVPCATGAALDFVTNHP